MPFNLTDGSKAGANEQVRWSRVTADLLTLLRLCIAVLLLAWPLLLEGTQTLVIVLWLNLAGLSTDALDGFFGRLSRIEPSWIGRNDYFFDLGLAFATAAALARLGYLWWWILGVWALGFLFMHLHYPGETVRMGFLFVLLALPPFLAILFEPFIGLIYLLFITLVAAAKFQKLKVSIGVFLSGLPGNWRDWLYTRLPRWLK